MRERTPAPGAATAATDTAAPLVVWDLPTRLFHWLLVACLVGSVSCASIGGNAMPWHFRFGYAILALLLFRIAWGFAGTRYARFASFPPSPARALRYLRGDPLTSPGHNPLGAFSVYALLLLLAIQAVTGLFSNDSIMWDAPLKRLVSNDTSDTLTHWHKLNRWLVFAMIALHLAAIAWYALVRRTRLVGPMIHGRRAPQVGVEAAAGAAAAAGVAAAAARAAPAAIEQVDDGWGTRLRALLLLAASAAIVWAVIALA